MLTFGRLVCVEMHFRNHMNFHPGTCLAVDHIATNKRTIHLLSRFRISLAVACFITMQNLICDLYTSYLNLHTHGRTCYTKASSVIVNLIIF